MRKMVIEEIKEDQTIVSASQDNCDPFTQVVASNMSGAIECAPAILESAAVHWAAHPKNPNYVPPKVVPKTPVVPKAAEPTKATPAPAEKPVDPKQELLAKLEAAQTENAPEEDKPEAKLQSELPLLKTGERGQDAEQFLQEVSQAEDTIETKAPEKTAEAPKNAEAPGKVFLATGEGPFANIQEAMDAMGIPKDKRPTHNRHTRLSKDLQAKILIK